MASQSNNNCRYRELAVTAFRFRCQFLHNLLSEGGGDPEANTDLLTELTSI